MKPEEMFDRLVENGLDFLKKAKSELKKNPKYSVIHFHAAVELFLKARLLHKDWSLVVSGAQDPDWERTLAGDFRSVSLAEAVTRLKTNVGSGLSTVQQKSFRKIGDHRNKMVHFFHAAQAKQKNDELTRSIVREQLEAWYFLHYLLTSQWRDVFEKWEKSIRKIDVFLRKMSEFLQVVFEDLKADIQAQEQAGVRFRSCPACRFRAQRFEEADINCVYDAKCLVCDLAERCVNICCPECGKLVEFHNEGFATCKSCDKSLVPNDVAEALENPVAAYRAAREGDPSWDRGNCSFCDGDHTVVRRDYDDWICAGCFFEKDSLSECRFCGELNTGDMKDSYVCGCNHCEGMIGRHEDD